MTSLDIFSDIKLNNKDPVYLQLVRYLKIKINLCELEHGFELPSRREVAACLAINPNTVQKAYKYLEDEGLLTTGNNVKSVLVINDDIKKRIRDELTSNTVLEFISIAKEIGLSFKEVIELLSKLWSE